MNLTNGERALILGAVLFLVFAVGTRLADFKLTVRVTDPVSVVAESDIEPDPEPPAEWTTSETAPQTPPDGSGGTVAAGSGSDASSTVLDGSDVEPPADLEAEARYEACVVEVVRSMLAAEHERRPAERIALYVGPAIDAARAHGVEPSLLVAVGYRESRLRPLSGDLGNACGPFQIHVQYLASVADGDETVDEACTRMLTSPTDAAEAAARRLARYPSVCHYNQGGVCTRADERGEPGTYTFRTLGVRDRINLACGVMP